MEILLRLFFALIFAVSGVVHLVRPAFFLPLMPTSLPSPIALIYLSGVVEIAVAAGLWIGPFRQMAVWGVLALLLVFTPLHVLDLLREKPIVGSKNIAVVRLILQVLFIIAAVYLLY